MAAQNGYYFASIFADYYDDLGLDSPNRGFFVAIGASVSFSFSLDFIHFGVRNDYGQIPIGTRFMLGILKNSQYYYSSHSELLLAQSMGYMGIVR